MAGQILIKMDTAVVAASSRAWSNPMNRTCTLTRYCEDLASPDVGVRDEAALRIWQAYSARLAGLVRRRLGHKIARREDEDDVLQSMFESFCRRRRNAGVGLRDRDELWRFLVLITLRKVANAAKRHTAA